MRALGYESVWVVLLPVPLTELLFPARRKERWLSVRGFLLVSLAFVLGAFIAWYGWTQRARIKIFHMPPYDPPPLYLLTGLGVILLLILGAYMLPSRGPRGDHAASHSVSVSVACWIDSLCIGDSVGSIRTGRMGAWIPSRPVWTNSGCRTCLGQLDFFSDTAMDVQP